MMTVVVELVPLASPLQPTKKDHPGLGKAVNVTIVPGR